MLCFICAAQLKFDFKLTSEARIQPGKTGREDMPVAFDFSHRGHALVTLSVQFLCSDWSKFDRWVHAENLCSILKLVYFESWSWQFCVSLWCFYLSFSTGCTKWNSASSRSFKSLLLFTASLFIGVLVEKYVAWKIRKSDFGWHRFRFSPCLMRKRVESDSGLTW